MQALSLPQLSIDKAKGETTQYTIQSIHQKKMNIKNKLLKFLSVHKPSRPNIPFHLIRFRDIIMPSAAPPPPTLFFPFPPHTYTESHTHTLTHCQSPPTRSADVMSRSFICVTLCSRRRNNRAAFYHITKRRSRQ